MRALVVDDSRATRSVLRKILQNAGYEVLEAADGQEALDYLRAGEVVDVALVDWNMPVMDGLDLVKALRSDRRFCELTVMMVTAETNQRRMAQALMAGADEYLMKPFDAETVLGKLAVLGLAHGSADATL